MNILLLITSLALLALPVIQCQSVQGVDWNYKDQDDWQKKWDSCAGKRQSPIDINTKQLRKNPDLRLDLSSYDTPRNVIFKNGGSAKVQLDQNGAPIVIYVGKEAAPFVFENMHIHWGGSRNEGSEHTINGRSQQAEIHFVHFNQKYKTFKEAKDKEDGLTVIAVLLKESLLNNKALKPLIIKTVQIQEYGSQINVNNFNLGKVLPKTRNNFYSYKGSLTTPSCSETVTWFVFAQTSPIGKHQIKYLRQLKDKSGEPIASNARKTQPINGRAVYVSVDRGIFKPWNALKALASFG